MAKTDYGPEVKSAMQEKESAADKASDKKKGIKEGSPQDVKKDASIGVKDPGMRPMPGARQAVMGNPEHMAQMQHAAGIAHAILGGRKMM